MPHKPKPMAEEQVRRLIRRGILPTEAERIVVEVMARGDRLQTPQERNAAATVTEADIERARVWWHYNRSVPRRYKRLLDARRVRRDA